jgi:hypothetical protein
MENKAYKGSFYSAPSNIHGKGIFASTTIEKGRTIGIALIRVTNTGNIDLDLKRTTLGRYVNHSEQPNAELMKHSIYSTLKASKKIHTGEEILVNYDDFFGRKFS